jgi:hypothetical protein
MEMVTQGLRVLRGSVRPLVTFGMTVAFVLAALAGREFATTTLGPPTMLMLGWWFYERAKRHENGTD